MTMRTPRAMNGRRLSVWVGVIASLLGAMSISTGSSIGPAQGQIVALPITPISHVVIILKENRSFDEYFGLFPGADGASQGQKSDGTLVPLSSTPDPAPHDICHSAVCFTKAYDNGKMDGFDKENGSDIAYTQMRESQRTYALGDRMFAPWKGPSFANNVFSVAGQAGQYDTTPVNSGGTGGSSIYGLPKSSTGPLSSYGWGCDDPPDTRVTMIGARGVLSSMYPCFAFPALPNVLAEHGISWKYYGKWNSGVPRVHNGLDSIRSVRSDSSLWQHVVRSNRFADDARNGRLPNVSWVLGGQLEHPPRAACAGENQTVNLLNAIMNGPDWGSTAVFIYWDEWGGFYDHVPPPTDAATGSDFVSYGFRVPLLVISPFTRWGSSSNGGYISHTFYSAPSTLRFIDYNWSLPDLTPKVSAQNDMTDLFDFSPAATRKPKLLLTTRDCTPLTAAERSIVRSEDPD
jgi:phospholipase C